MGIQSPIAVTAPPNVQKWIRSVDFPAIRLPMRNTLAEQNVQAHFPHRSSHRHVHRAEPSPSHLHRIVSAAPSPPGTLVPMLYSADRELLRRAIALATQNVLANAGGPFGAVIACNGQIVAEGVNTVTATCDPTAHAEVNAIRAAAKALNRFSLAGCQLYSSCEPCPMCLSAAHWARIDGIFFGATAADAARAGFDDAILYQELRKDPPARRLPQTQLLGDEAWASFAAWIASPTKVNY